MKSKKAQNQKYKNDKIQKTKPKTQKYEKSL